MSNVEVRILGKHIGDASELESLTETQIQFTGFMPRTLGLNLIGTVRPDIFNMKEVFSILVLDYQSGEMILSTEDGAKDEVFTPDYCFLCTEKSV